MILQHQPQPLDASRQSNIVLPPRACTPGGYDAEVLSAELIGFHWRRSPDNLDGMTLRVRCRIEDEQGQADVFDCVDITHDRRLGEIALACKLDPALSVGRIVDRLAGCRCRVSVKNIMPQQGKNAGMQKAVVGSWLY